MLNLHTEKATVNGRTREARHLHFDSLAEMERTPVDPLNKELIRRYVSEDYMSKKTSWWGVTGGWGEVQERVVHGWPEGMERMRKSLGSLASHFPKVKSQRRVKTRGPQGNELDIHRVYSGDFQRAWKGTARKERFPAKKQGKKVTIAVELAAAAHRSANELFWRGAVTALMAEQLVRSGYAVEIVASMTSEHLLSDESYHCITMMLKTFDQRLNMEMLVATTALSGFYRGYGFRAKGILPYRVGSNMGRADNLLNWIPPKFRKHSSHMIYVNEVYGEYEAIAFVKKHSAKLLSERIQEI